MSEVVHGREKRTLLHQLKKAQRNAFQTQNIEYALAPPKVAEKFVWKDEKDWPKQERRKFLETLDFYPLVYENEPHKLLILAYDMFENLGLIEKFNIPSNNLQSFLINLRRSYREVPFHNFHHAFNVAQSLYFFLTTCKAAEKFSPLELLCILVAAFCHDIDHPGMNNTFLANANTKLSLLYNDFSILEQHHCNQAFELLYHPENNIFLNLDKEQNKLVRKYIVGCILATDLAVHGEFMSKLKAKMDNINWESFDDKKLVMCCLVKCADISNEIRPSHIGKMWAEKVMMEFFAQSAIEKALGMVVAPHMDPEQTNTASGQIGFISYLAHPLFAELTKIFPLMQVCCDQMLANKENWQKIEKQLKEKKQ